MYKQITNFKFLKFKFDFYKKKILLKYILLLKSKYLHISINKLKFLGLKLNFVNINVSLNN